LGGGPKTGAEGAAGSEGAGEEGLDLPRYLPEETSRQLQQTGGHSWAELLNYWALIEADLADRGLDLWHPDSYRAAPWHKLRSRVEMLMHLPPAIVFKPDGKSFTVPATRIGLALEPPTDDEAQGGATLRST
jgi:hypothetical protein